MNTELAGPTASTPPDTHGDISGVALHAAEPGADGVAAPGDGSADAADSFAGVSVTVDTTGGNAWMPAPASRTASVPVAPAPVFAPASSGAGAVGGGVMALMLVVGLILALAWLAKRMPGVGATTASNPALRVVGSLALGPRERVVVVEVGQAQLLLSVGAGGTRTLHTLEEPLPAAATAPSPFASLLAQHFGKKS